MLHLFEKPIALAPADIPDAPHALRITIPENHMGHFQDQAFVYRLQDQTCGFINRCPHVNVPLDLDDGLFFDLTELLICRMHGARFDPLTGARLTGPAPHGLYKLQIETRPEKTLILGWVKS
ncbi:MAG: Rieske 2Fe-2S domain-containing protein [Leptospiraceae bacterium]|nr:Rieske 2Fe-2S domain-containing protein [Leptospiraceae bacterium]